MSDDEESDGESGDGDVSDGDTNHLDDVADGAGCTEIWERLSERREE
ncbi:hypothetical protein C465_04876 [Halorubrum distributum JCM 9100]|uniref:Uncharacterized protein n=2 Tax=Halorubrum distributum TaxID=29283 RepID=M0EX22_9EURY|nr:hypothetical protein [Halorubrum distributum]ELZ50974.1 hypothetical protein C465_04876 [Halorubrum distributum JCM 9100]ELZ52928.1 hypothetical protein C466_10232 [Halorubrum distributum JCM 10118]